MNNRVKTIFKIIISLVLICYFLSKNDLILVFENLKQINISIWIIIIILVYVSVLINALKWKRLLIDYDLKDLYKVNIVTGFYMLVLPGQLMSEAVKALILGRKYNELEKVSASVLVDKITSIIALLLIGTFGLLFTKFEGNMSLLYLFLLSAITCFLMIFLIRLKVIKKLLSQILVYLSDKHKILKFLCGIVNKLINAWESFSSSWKNIAINIIYGLIYQLIAVFSCTILSNSIEINVGFIDWMWIEAVLTMALLLPITIGGIGVREGTLIGVLGMLGVTPEKAIVISFALLGQQIVRAIPGGVIEFHRVFFNKENEKGVADNENQ